MCPCSQKAKLNPEQRGLIKRLANRFTLPTKLCTVVWSIPFPIKAIYLFWFLAVVVRSCQWYFFFHRNALYFCRSKTACLIGYFNTFSAISPCFNRAIIFKCESIIFYGLNIGRLLMCLASHWCFWFHIKIPLCPSLVPADDPY